MKKYILILVLILLASTSVFSEGGMSYSKIRKYYLPEFDWDFTEKLANCEQTFVTNWEGTYRYIISGKDKYNRCIYNVQFNPWMIKRENRWIDTKECRLSQGQLYELTQAMKNYDDKMNTYQMGPYKVTSTKLDYILQMYDYYGSCRNLKR